MGVFVHRSLSAALALLVGVALLPATATANPHAPIPAKTLALMSSKNMDPAAPILMRVFKKESLLEIWKLTRSGEYELLKAFPVCRWSGQLGPKRKEGDRQAPEGFYTVGPRQLNPNSAYHLSFDIGFPNAYDKAHGASGAFLMVHGSCTSAGCFAMTDQQIEEIYALAREAFAGGQQSFQFQAFPFRMNAQNMARHRYDPNIAFWRMLKEGHDRFEATRREPRVSVAGRRYVFPHGDPALEAKVAAYRAREEASISALVESGAAVVRTTFADGGQNAIFAALAQRGARLGVVSRPEALAYAGKEIVLVPARKPVRVAEAQKPVEAPPAREAADEAPSAENLIAGASPILPASFTPWPRAQLATAI